MAIQITKKDRKTETLSLKSKGINAFKLDVIQNIVASLAEYS